MRNMKFVDKIVGSGELPIKELNLFAAPSEDEHCEIYNKLEKRFKKNTAVSGFYSLICLVLGVFYLYLTIATKSLPMVISSVIFLGIVANSVFSYIKTDRLLKNFIGVKKYEVCRAKIHHLMPTFGTGRQTVKIVDPDGKIYSYEFLINRKMKKRFKKDPDFDVYVVKVDGKYMLISVDEKDGEKDMVKEEG